MTTRKYSSRSQQTTLSAALTSTATSATVVSGTSLMGGATISAGQTYTVVIDPDTALEEIVDVTSVASNSLVLTRGIDGSSGQAHSAGAVVRHMAIGRDYREANTHIEASTGVHGIATTSSIVGTTDTQELTNKTLTSPIINNPTLTSTGGIDVANIVFEGTTADAFETTLTVIDPTADRTITLPNATGQVVLRDTTDTLTNKTLTSPTISGSPVITGLSSASMVASSAAPKDYVDSILGSATAASASATSAATSATSAATSASSSATSATSSATSATASATSATAAATSATSSATSASSSAASATSSATSATAAATSATSAATSASSAAASATSAANSVSTIASYVTAAATSATSSANSATASSTSASSAATSASSAATSATSAATSATSAATTYTAYDARYLGSKSSAPSVNNVGGALLVGATYWNTTTTTMYVWTGSVWNAISSAAAVTAVSGTSGRVSSSGGSSPVIDLVATSVTAGTYQAATITVDAYGRITSASITQVDPIPQVLMLMGA